MPTNNEILNAKLGSQQVKKIYFDSQIIWQLWTPSSITTQFWYDAADLATITATGNQDQSSHSHASIY